MPTTLITGCDYGIGFEFARQYAESGWRVHAVCLEEASRGELGRLAGEIHFHQADVSIPGCVRWLASNLGDTAIDLLINNSATNCSSRSRALTWWQRDSTHCR